jgi:outer membrane protein OmpA-like peptidoglycan-associated protein
VLCTAAIASLLAVLGVPGVVLAAPDAQSFEPPAGETTGFATPEPEALPHGVFSLGLSSSYARRPLVREVDCPFGSGDPSCVLADGETPVVRDLIQLEAMLAAGLFDVLEAGLVLPFAWQMQADDLARPTELGGKAGLSDLRLGLKLPLVRGSFALALALNGSLPTGDADHGRGAEGVVVMPQAIARVTSGSLSLALALGYHVRKHARLLALEQDDELDAALALALGLSRAVDLRAELHGRLGIANAADQASLEARLGAALFLDPVELLVGLGGALPPSSVGNGTPALRVILAARVMLGAGAQELGPVHAASSGDGDRDGLTDDRDLCGLLPEDDDDFVDEDGCPDLDDDADGLRDEADRCPRVSEDRDGFEDDDGCPEPDNDSDKIADASDACAMDPEDRDRFEDSDGCPEPGPNPLRVALENGRITLSEPITFDHDSFELRASTLPMLDRVAALIERLPARQAIRIDGYTDASGNPAYDRVISARRARAVAAYLVKRGIAEARLTTRGLGSTAPLQKGSSPEARARNRRVELHVE